MTFTKTNAADIDMQLRPKYTAAQLGNGSLLEQISWEILPTFKPE